MATAISIKGLSVKYGSYVAVQNCSFDVEEGEIFGLLGPNGAGKSSIMKIISGQHRQNSGTVSLYGNDLFFHSLDLRKTIGIVPQEYSFALDFTVDENLSYFSKLYGFSGKELEDRIAWQLSRYLLDNKRSVRASDLSGGYKRLLNFALSTIHSPKLILLDEPTVGLDPDIRSTVWGRIKDLRKDGATIILTTHYLEEAGYLCDRLAIIFRGNILAIGTPSDLILQYGGDTKIFIQLSSAAEKVVGDVGKLKGILTVFAEKNLLMVTCVNTEVVKLISMMYRLLSDREIAVKDSYVKEPTLDDVFKVVVGMGIGVK
ncbi:MAG: ABC transporter ATP-binding protein [Candidatus Micrarchaeota archaeon]